jgi:RNA polymerase-binding transcription factor DksA
VTTKAQATKAPATKAPTTTAAKAAAEAPVVEAPAPAAKKAAAPASETPKVTKAASAKAAAASAKADEAAAASDAPVVAKPAPRVPLVRAIKPPPEAYVRTGKEFDAKFLAAQRVMLNDMRLEHQASADRWQAEADSLRDDQDPGDVQFDDESGEGDPAVVERERDIVLSNAARQRVSEIDAALERLDAGNYGFSIVSGKPIPHARLEFMPWATELVEEKVGALGSRR